MRTLIVAMLCFVASPLFSQQAEASRAAIEAIIRKDKPVSITAPRVRAPYLSTEEVKIRQQRAERDWPDFLRNYTEAASGPNENGSRILKSSVFWREFFGSMTSDDIIRGVDSWTLTLKTQIAYERKKVELEPDVTLRSRMISRLETAEKDLDSWRANDRDSGRARHALSMSLKALIAPL